MREQRTPGLRCPATCFVPSLSPGQGNAGRSRVRAMRACWRSRSLVSNGAQSVSSRQGFPIAAHSIRMDVAKSTGRAGGPTQRAG